VSRGRTSTGSLQRPGSGEAKAKVTPAMQSEVTALGNKITQLKSRIWSAWTQAVRRRPLTNAELLDSWRVDGTLSGGHSPSQTIGFRRVDGYRR
jgi:hypothetical protein